MIGRLTDQAFSSLPNRAEVAAHIDALEAGFADKNRITFADQGGPDRGAHCDFDVVLAGGGLSLVYAAYFAQKGLKVAVFDKRRIGCGHREWNISRRELAPLSGSSLFTDEEVASLLELEYREGIVRWHGGSTYPVRGVLDCVVNAERLLDGLREKATAAGAQLIDHHALSSYTVGKGGVTVELAPKTTLTTRLLVDAMGAQSPHAKFDLVCPTVGGVLSNLEEGTDPQALDPMLGEILVTTEGVEETRQHIWEGFPQPGKKLTTYLFYYAEPHQLPEQPLWSLYERFFQTLPRYKRGDARLDKATYGFIPAYSRLGPMPTAPHDRVILVGDAAGRHSPLTFCGFGSMIRSFLPVADRLLEALGHDRLQKSHLERVWQEPPGLSVMGGLTLMMVPGRALGSDDPDAINRLLDAAFSTLSDMGNETYASFVRDEIGFRDFYSFMRKTAKKRPTIYDEVFRQMSKKELFNWSQRFIGLAFRRWNSGTL